MEIIVLLLCAMEEIISLRWQWEGEPLVDCDFKHSIYVYGNLYSQLNSCISDERKNLKDIIWNGEQFSKNKFQILIQIGDIAVEVVVNMCIT